MVRGCEHEATSFPLAVLPAPLSSCPPRTNPSRRRRRLPRLVCRCIRLICLIPYTNLACLPVINYAESISSSCSAQLASRVGSHREGKKHSTIQLASCFLLVVRTDLAIMARVQLWVAAACAVVLALAAPSLAGDPDMLQDICVADLASPIKLNGFPCKANVTADDFFFAGLKKPGNTNNPAGSMVTAANVQSFPGVNTLGVSMARIDYAPGGQNPPHTHPRATEIIFVLEGVLEVGFITTANKLFTKTVTMGEVFVFPRGLVHFQQNRGHGPAAVIAAFNSQLQGTQAIAATLFAAAPPVPSDVLAKAFRVDTAQVDAIKAKFK